MLNNHKKIKIFQTPSSLNCGLFDLPALPVTSFIQSKSLKNTSLDFNLILDKKRLRSQRFKKRKKKVLSRLRLRFNFSITRFRYFTILKRFNKKRITSKDFFLPSLIFHYFLFKNRKIYRSKFLKFCKKRRKTKKRKMSIASFGFISRVPKKFVKRKTKITRNIKNCLIRFSFRPKRKKLSLKTFPRLRFISRLFYKNLRKR
jgi:hypothetical protein